MERAIGLGTEISGNLLDSGHLVITALMLVVFVLSVWIVVLYRVCRKCDDEKRRLIDEIIEMAKDGFSTLQGVSSLSGKIESLYWRGKRNDMGNIDDN